jgi:opacity protein-like surface antigen
MTLRCCCVYLNEGIFMSSFSKNLTMGLLACAAMAGAQAQSSAPASSSMTAPSLKGVYVGGTIGNTSITGLSSKIGGGGYLGYQINDNFAVEAGAQYLGSFDVRGTSVSASAYNASVLAGVPLNPNFSIYGRLGIGSVTDAANGTTAKVSKAVYGVGAKYNIDKNLAVRAEYTRLKSDTGTFGVGLQYSF